MFTYVTLRAAVVLGIAVITLAGSANAQDRPAGRGQQNQGQRQMGPGDRPQGGERPDPEQMAARLLQRFDSNGDQQLNAQELAQALMAMREMGPPPRRHGNQQQNDEEEGGNRRGPGGNQRPPRPSSN